MPDAADEVALESSAGFAAGLAFGLFALEEGLGLGVVAGLGQRESVERAVELSVAARIEAVPVSATRGRRDRSCAREPRELGVAGEARDAGDLADQLGRDQRPAARVGGEPRRERDDERGELVLEVGDRARELADAIELVARNADASGLLGARQAPREALRPTLGGECAQRDLELGPEVVQLPAQIVDQCGALFNEHVAWIDEQPDVYLGSGQLRDRQSVEAFPDRG